MVKRLIEYALVVLVAIIVSMLVIMFIIPRDPVCTDCQVSVPQVRADCDKQFYTSDPRTTTLAAEEEVEYLASFWPVSAGAASSTGYPTGFDPYGTPTAAAPAVTTVREPGYVMVRVLPQSGYGYSGGAVTNSFDPATVAPGQKWNDVTVTVARYANPLRNEQECSSPVAFREGRFENYCTFVPDFTSGDSEVSYRIFVSNRSSSPVDICIVTNCNMSSSNKLCSIEQAPLQ